MKQFVRVTPMPDELSLGHEARIAWVNGIRSSIALAALIRTTLAEQGYIDEGLPRLHQIALVSLKTPAEYTQSHSMIAAIRVAAKSGVDIPHYDASAKEYVRQHGMRTQRPGVYCCTKCIQEDCQAHSFSWYRRKHHLIGVDWCHIHGDPLYKVVDAHPFQHQPHVWLSEGKLEPIKACLTILPEDDFLSRYVSIACALLDRSKPYCAEKITPRLAQRAKDCNLRVGAIGQRPLISDRLFEIAPSKWLRAHLKGYEQKVAMETFRRIDFVVRSKNTAGPGDAYAMAAAILYDTAEEAIADLSLADEADTYIETKKINRRGDRFWDGDIWQHYLNSDGVHTKIADKTGIEPTHLSKRLTSLGLPSLRTHGPNQLAAWRAFEQFSKGESLATACNLEGIEVEALEEVLRKCSIRVFRAIQLIQEKSKVE